eukprot:TRINITY_DN4328_c0_g2_i2.p2 TRINITY_DN4328_c0_g2~~TRINITY_DN4328_c0_g2_i2.p2  ORF type:complete len:163 (-),score=15.09 TRINITY_DN4328_c0_g2_i2:194-682(-)
MYMIYLLLRATLLIQQQWGNPYHDVFLPEVQRVLRSNGGFVAWHYLPARDNERIKLRQLLNCLPLADDWKDDREYLEQLYAGKEELLKKWSIYSEDKEWTYDTDLSGLCKYLDGWDIYRQLRVAQAVRDPEKWITNKLKLKLGREKRVTLQIPYRIFVRAAT